VNEQIVFGLVCFTLGIIASILPGIFGIFKEEWASRKIDRELKDVQKNYDKRNRIDKLQAKASGKIDKLEGKLNKGAGKIPEEYEAEDDPQPEEEDEEEKKKREGERGFFS